ncbi:hypothetical protein QTJ16_006185 [Diplocarpon rosae]|uniref:EDC4-like protein pdc1 beta-propeller domain-containing protein n=1 Tax=Diplocarpon rosae TaxID=946125 RepID=A0AAD9SV23_9HELO|nr:hypothetical protein QTJ16_006185 [Diplocarpon rosae]PBP23966.1 hypothetical protein BUE80_DR005050 [Diplocarpon rosae]
MSSGYPAGAGDGTGLDSLLASLRHSAKPAVQLEPSYGYYGNGNSNYFTHSGSAQLQSFQQASVSSPIPTPPVGGQQPHHASAVISPAESPQQRVPAAAGASTNADRTSSLLNLLKFSQASTGAQNQSAPIGPPLPPSRDASFASSSLHGPDSASSHSRGESDLLAALMGAAQTKPPVQASPQFAPTLQPPQSTFGSNGPPPADTHNYLLGLLNQPKPPQTEQPPQPAQVMTPPSKPSSPEDIEELAQALEDSTVENSMMGSATTEGVASSFGKENKEPTTKSTPGLFTYVNPFEQLAASSPRNRTPKIASAGLPSTSSPKIQILKRQEPDHKRKSDDKGTPSISSSALLRQKNEPSSQSSSAPPTPLPDGRTQVEALIGIGAADNKASVHAALSEVGDRADKEVQDAISRAENAESQASIEKDLRDMLAATTEKEFESTAQLAAASIKQELEKDEFSGALDSLPTSIAAEVKTIIDEAAHGHIADSWESADAEDNPVKESVVKVFNFPMKPWSSITIIDSQETRPAFRDEAVMDIARLKKEFDQIDRTLVTASNNFIVYGMSRNGGLRIIRQDDGKDARIFTETHDRIFNVVISSSSAERKDAIIGTGISGTVYWALVKDGDNDHIEDTNPEMYGFALPPIQSSDTESPGGVLKTRSRKSSGHPDFFAVGRGKFIYVIWPSVILKQSLVKNGKDRIVDTEKYLSKHSLKVNTGKAGKDFTFSGDDTIIVSLDKAGRVKFWDVRSLTSSEIGAHPSRTQQIEIKNPLLTLITTPASEKSWPTSVLFVDKLRPYQRGGALRYLIVGMKQNHTLQLWDLALGKPVQEINLPHGKESDAVCSVLYHAATGMIIVGHPTRNSIYFLHLSAPKYNLPKSITQAEFMEKLVAADPSLPKPESTAVISGMREYSFADKGMLRSLDILQTPNSVSTLAEPSALFELYSMHSKGVTCLTIKQADLGWTSDNKVIHPVDAKATGAITIETLKEISPTPAPEVSESTQAAPPNRNAPRATAKETSAKDSPKKAHQGDSSAPTKAEAKAEKKDQNANSGSASTNAPEKAERKKRRKGTSEPAPVDASHVGQASKTIVLDPSSHVRNGLQSRATATAPSEASAATVAAQDFNDVALKNIESRVSTEVKKLFGESLDSLYHNIKIDRSAQNNVFNASQDAMLRLVSETLTDNIESTLSRKVSQGIQQSVIPALAEASQKALKENLGSALSAHLTQSLPTELQKVLPEAVNRSLQHPQNLKLLAESLAKSVAFRVEEHFAVLIQTIVIPQFQGVVAQSTQKFATDLQRQNAAQLDALQEHRQADTVKIEQLTQLVTGLTATISSMAEAQTEFQARFLKVQEQAADDRRLLTQRGEGSVITARASSASIARPPTAQTGQTVEKTATELEYEATVSSITKAMQEGQYENAVVQWLQTRQEQLYFRNLFVNYDPAFLQSLSPLLLLSLGATVSLDFTGDLLPQRISWMEVLVDSFQLHVNAGTVEPQVRDLIPKIMGIYVQRIEHLFMRISQVAAHDPILKRLSLLVVSSNRILETGVSSAAPNQAARH